MLDFIYSINKRQELENILNSSHANHAQRLYLLGFLNSCGLSSKEIISIVHKYNRWSDYDASYSEYQIKKTLGDNISSKYSKSFNISNIKDINCKDTSIFKKYNVEFFKNACRTAYEYDTACYNLNGLMRWQPCQYSIYRAPYEKSNTLFTIDLDCNDIGIGWIVAKQIYNLENWDFFKFSGNRGFHLSKRTPNISKDYLHGMAEDIYDSIKTNLVSFGSPFTQKKEVHIDTSALSPYKLIRGYCIHMATHRFGIPVNDSMNIEEILDVSSNIEKVEAYLKGVK